MLEVAVQVGPEESARAAGLRYVRDESPGVSREGKPGAFQYRDPHGRLVDDPDTLTRIKSLAIPPAWTNVWIATRANAHLQATGRDARGRKQYRYHPRWREVRDGTKYNRMLAFAAALPGIRDRVKADLSRSGLPRERVLALVVRLLEATLIRVGNDEYARTNGSYGLSTMRDQHAKIEGSTVRFRFRGKSGVEHEIRLSDRRLAQIVKRCQDLPGQDLFQYIDDSGEPQAIGSADVNEYLRDIAGEDFTAKDFRTWAGTVLAALALAEVNRADTAREAKRNIVAAIESVAKRLGNTPSVCRKCYVHPGVLEAYLDGLTVETVRQEAEALRDSGGLQPDEASVVRLLEARLSRSPGEIRAEASRARTRKTPR